jgi:hypothetical protein
MLRFNRPKEPPEFARRVARARTKIEAIVAEPRSPESGDFDSVWREFKRFFRDAQCGKCGYCETFIRGDQYGDLEHFHPKAELKRIASHVTRPWTSEERPPAEVVCETGYWWLAYEWLNYLYACVICNEYWKRELFPIETPQVVPLARGCDASEKPLLLNPYGDEVPERHLRFDFEGRIFAREDSRHGNETIETCGLHRYDLVYVRGEIARRVRGLLHEITHGRTQETADRSVRELHELGARGRRFAGMVRMLVEDRMPGMVCALWPDHF